MSTASECASFLARRYRTTSARRWSTFPLPSPRQYLFRGRCCFVFCLFYHGSKRSRLIRGRGEGAWRRRWVRLCPSLTGDIIFVSWRCRAWAGESALCEVARRRKDTLAFKRNNTKLHRDMRSLDACTAVDTTPRISRESRGISRQPPLTRTAAATGNTFNRVTESHVTTLGPYI